MILLIDNYDSFSYNLYQLIGTFREDLKVVRNDEYTVEEIRKMKPDAVILSPGPGKPADAGICVEAAGKLAGEIPVLGVCLGHQAICEAFGATVSYAGRMMHGKSSPVQVDTDSGLFRGMGKCIQAARYHSLSVVPESVPDVLRITAVTADGEIMAVEHKTAPVYGLQFHPESILTPEGHRIINNFLEGIRHD